MTKFTVEFTRSATQSFNEICDWYSDQSASAEEKWIDAVGRVLDALESDPLRYPPADEPELASMKLQQLNFGVSSRPSHRCVFIVRPSQRVVVYAIRHHAQANLTPEDI